MSRAWSLTILARVIGIFVAAPQRGSAAGLLRPCSPTFSSGAAPMTSSTTCLTSRRLKIVEAGDVVELCHDARLVVGDVAVIDWRSQSVSAGAVRVEASRGRPVTGRPRCSRCRWRHTRRGCARRSRQRSTASRPCAVAHDVGSSGGAVRTVARGRRSRCRQPGKAAS